MTQKPTVDPDLLPEAFLILKIVRDAGNESPHDLVLEYSNAAYAKLVGIPVEELQGKSLFSLFPGAEERWIFFIHEILKNNVIKEVVKFVPDLDKVLTVLCFPIRDGYCGCLVHDASPSLAMVKAIRYQEKRYKILADYTNLLRTFLSIHLLIDRFLSR